MVCIAFGLDGCFLPATINDHKINSTIITAYTYFFYCVALITEVKSK